MSKSAKTTIFLKECMADALLKLMETIPFEKITVPQITKLAGVGRTTWFRNFTTKTEALVFKRNRLWERWADEHKVQIRNHYAIENAETFFAFQYAVRENTTILYKAKLQSVVYEAFYVGMTPQCGTNARECYESRFYSYALFGFIDEWCNRGFYESPQEIAEMYRDIINKS